MAGYSRTRSLIGFISITACAMTMAAAAFFSASWTANDRYFHSAFHSASLERQFHDTMAAFDKISVAPMRHTEDVIAPDRQSSVDVLFESHRQPGQDWRIAATAYRHIDPGRRAFS